jgi:hypothetical protein
VFSFIGNIVQGFTDMVGITSQLDRNIDSINAKYKQSDKQIASNLKILQETGQTKAALEEQLNQYKGFVNKYIEIQKERQKFNEELTAEEKDGLDEAVNNIAITQFKIEQFDKQQAEKLKQERDKRNKEIQDKEKAKNDEIKKINQEALDAIAKANLTAWGKELFDLNKQEQSKLAVLRQGSTEYLNVQEQFRIARKEVNDKYDKLLADAEVQAFIDEVQKSYDQEKAKQEAIQKAKDDAKAQAAANAKGRTTIAEAVLIRTERENVVSDSDSPDTVRQKIDNIEKARLDAENASFNERRLAAAGNFAELIKLYQEHEQNKTQIQADGTQARIALDEAEKQAKLQTLQAVGQGLGAIGDLIGRQTVAGKALGIAQATIDTFIGANKALAQGGTIGIVTAAAVIASGLANVKRIIDTKVPNDTTGKNIPIANTNASAPIINSSAIGQLPAIQDVRVINYNNQPIRSYITQRDLDNNEAKQKFLNSLRTY